MSKRFALWNEMCGGIGLFALILLAIYLLSLGNALAGTYRNDSNQSLVATNTDGKTVSVMPNHTIESYQLLDQIDSRWTKTRDDPQLPLGLAYHSVSEASAGNYTVGIYLSAKRIKVVNLGSTDVRLHANSASNPYYWLLRQADANNKSDEITINNDKTISQLVVECTDASGCSVAIWEVP